MIKTKTYWCASIPERNKIKVEERTEDDDDGEMEESPKQEFCEIRPLMTMKRSDRSPKKQTSGKNVGIFTRLEE